MKNNQKYDAYWISPDGQIFGVSRKHINFIRDNLSLFKISHEEYKSIYDKHGEKYGFEGKARREIMLKAIKQGWVRLRHNKNSGWTIEMWEMSERNKHNIEKWHKEYATDNTIINTLNIYILNNNEAKND